MKKNVLKLSDDELRKLQLEQLDILIEFDRICRKHNIKYIIDSGTLLGAVRHKGFIPWDDDVDVRMLRSEYDKFCEAAGELGKDYFFQNHTTDKGYPWLYSKIRKNGTTAVRVGQEKLKMHQGIFIDIFVCDGVPDSKYLKKLRDSISLINRKLLYSVIARDNAPTAAERTFWELVSFIKPDAAHFADRLVRTLFNENNCSRVGSNGYHHPVEIKGFKKEWLTDLTELEFENRFFLAPKEYDECLTFIYGDYMKLPPPEKRTGNGEFTHLSFRK
ncbi:MAG: phosphorylcholine transferase LicD [Huintestinicola sp.]|uniref:LicD family protein n=1 Tax=Huintestinicola sp. TaxID=2981661 RepID=UPI003F0AE7E3